MNIFKKLFFVIVVISTVAAANVGEISTNPEITLTSVTESATANHAAAGSTKSMVIAARNATVAVSTDTGFGSGFFVTDGGILVTNYHVIHGAEKIFIWFYDETIMNRYEAIVMGIDPVADLAIIQAFVPEYLQPVSFLNIEGNKNDIEITDEVFAIGHPGGLDWTVTEGIVSHANRGSRNTPYVRLLQHSATIAPGSSGGPLINDDGLVIGVNTYVVGEYQNFAYAVRGDIVYKSVMEMLAVGEALYPAIGVRTVSLNPASRQRLMKENPEANIPDTFGLMVYDKEEDFSDTGLINFDIIVAVNGRSVNNIEDMSDIMLDLAPGVVINLLVIRDRTMTNIDFTLRAVDFDYITFYDEKNKKGPGPGQR